MKHRSRPRLALLAWALFGCAQLAWPGISTCTDGTTLDNYQPSGLASGCAYIDKSFSNIGVNSQGQSVLGTPSTITLTSNPTVGDTLTSTNGLGVADFTSPAWTVSNGTQGGSDVEFVVQANTGGTLGGYTYTNGVNGYVSPTDLPWAISSITLNPNDVSSTGPGNIAGGITDIIFGTTFCLNSTAGGNGSCPTAELGTMEIIWESNGSGGVFLLTDVCIAPGNVASVGCSGNGFSIGSGGITYTIPGQGVQALSMFDDIFLDSQTGTSVTVTDVINTFGEESLTPEPSSCLLVGTAAAAMVLLRYRRATLLNTRPAADDMVSRSPYAVVVLAGCCDGPADCASQDAAEDETAR